VKTRGVIAAAFAVSVALLAPAPVPAATSGVVGPLHTKGNKIYDARNRPLVLRGVVAEWLDYYPTLAGSLLDDASIGVMKQWGANIVRVPLGQQYWVSSECAHVSTYAGLVDQVVQSVTSRGMVALLDLHWSTRRRCWPAGNQFMPDERSVTFWQEVAARYKDNPLVAFDLYNEPHYVSWQVWRNGGYVYDYYNKPNTDWIAPGMQTLYQTVRSTGARNLVIASGNGWGDLYPPARYLLRGYNIVYGFHNFACPNNPPALCKNTPEANSTNYRYINRWAPFIRQHPVILSEFGWPDPDQGGYNQFAIQWAESRGIGWTVFNWSAGVTLAKPWGILRDPITFAPSAAGIPVQEALSLHRSP
jgi:endoglucanase